MHRFERGDAPVDFAKIPRKHKQNWEAFGDAEPEKKACLRNALYERQHRHCAYCEREIKSDDKVRPKGSHIDHLERRGEAAGKTFDWNNLFLSCDFKDTCGRYKDKGLKNRKFNVDDIVDPSRENPLDYFSFDEQGKIGVVEGATPEIIRKVDETIRVFNLNGSQDLLETRRWAYENAKAFHERLQPTDEEIEEYLKDLPDDFSCISVYYAYFDLRAEYEERFTSTRYVPIRGN